MSTGRRSAAGVGRIVDAHAVDQHQRVVRIGATQVQRARAAAPADLVEVHAGHAAQYVGELTGFLHFEVFARQHRDVGGHVLARGRHARAGNDDLWLRVGRLRRGGRRGAISGKKHPEQADSRLGETGFGRGFFGYFSRTGGGLMPKFARRGLAVLTIAALASFPVTHAQRRGSRPGVPGQHGMDAGGWCRHADRRSLTRQSAVHARSTRGQRLFAGIPRAEGRPGQPLCPGPLRRRTQRHGRVAERRDPVPCAALRRGIQQARTCADARGARR